MEKEVENLFDKNILEKAAKSFEINTDNLKLIGKYQNFVYEYTKQNKDYILRITHSSHRTEDEMMGELEWILYLSNNGVNVSKPIYSKANNLLEKIDIKESYFIVTSFEKAIGKRLSYPEYLDYEELFKTCGMVTGKIHALSKRYIPSKKNKRHEWKDNYYLSNINKVIDLKERKIYSAYEAIIKEISSFDKDINSFGLIHGDINLANFFVDKDNITIFDFDECQYSWFIEDIAIQLFYTIYIFLDDSIKEREEQCHKFIKNFMEGYRIENPIEDGELYKIITFLKLRELIVYVGIMRNIDKNNLSTWIKNYIEQSKSRIERQEPLVKF